MNKLRKYYENTSCYQCAECKHCFELNWWQWLIATMKFDITHHRYVKCPRCGAKHWLKAKKKVD